MLPGVGPEHAHAPLPPGCCPLRDGPVAGAAGAQRFVAAFRCLRTGREEAFLVRQIRTASSWGPPSAMLRAPSHLLQIERPFGGRRICEALPPAALPAKRAMLGPRLQGHITQDLFGRMELT